ncbi:MAG: HAD hydrolase-like protein, partial [Xanthomonadaceae bacterium]|nr:HAD hydrolase-like protein [Xanthomonadaceae bacterium]
FHQEAKVRESGLSRWFGRIEIVSEKDAPTYARLLQEFGVAPSEFVMIGNSLRSDIAPLLELGAWGIHVPYHVTWAHEAEADVDAAHPRLRVADQAAELPALVDAITREAASP